MIFSDPGVYVIQEMKTVPRQPKMPKQSAAIIGPAYQIVDTDYYTASGAIFTGNDPTNMFALKDVESWVTAGTQISIPFPHLIAGTTIVPESVVVTLIKRDGRKARLNRSEYTYTNGDPHIIINTANSAFTVAMGRINDRWGGNTATNSFTGLSDAEIHIEYRALRSDLVGQVLAIQGADDIQAIIGKPHPDNPLGLAGAIAATQTRQGIYFVPTPAKADGDADGVTAALSLLESKKVYSVVLLSKNTADQMQVVSHVTNMSEPEEKSFRFAWVYRPFSNPVAAHLSLVKSEQVREMVGFANTVYNRRVAVIPHDVYVDVDGQEALLPGYYLCAAYAALKSQIAPQQGLTRYPLGGVFKRLTHSDDYFRPTQMKDLSRGGVFMCTQEAEGVIASRFQVTTNMNNNKTKQISIVYAADAYSLGFIATMEKFIGINNITRAILDEIYNTISAFNFQAFSTGLILNANVVSININPHDESQVDIVIDATFPTPLDKIVLRLKF